MAFHTRIPYTPRLARAAAGLLLTGALLSGAGCSWFHATPGGVLTATSGDHTKAFAPMFTTAAYTAFDADTADIYLSDLPRERFTNPKDTLADAHGTIMHLHIFLQPEAGATPIDATACNVTIRQLVMAGPLGSRIEAPRMGLYAGGGFVLPDGTLGKGSVGGSIDAASQRLTRSTPGFTDLLGSGSLSGKFSAPLDDELAKAMSGKLETLVSRLPVPGHTDDATPGVAAPKGNETPADGSNGKPASDKPATK